MPFHPVVTGRAATVLLALLAGVWIAGHAGAEAPAPDLAAGKAAYDRQCARCHGATGRGDGVDAKRFYPRPRDLTIGVYKFRSTASGTPPTDDDLLQTLAHGLPGTNMPDWPHLDEGARRQVVHYLKSLSPIFETSAPAPVQTAPDPGRSRADLAKGRALYEQLGCAACHGSAGRANGTSAAGLVDDWGMPVRPANLTQGWTYRGGSHPQAIMLRVLTGIDGAGMPSYAEAVSPEDAWQLAYYVASLQEPASWNMIAHPHRVEGPLPTAWDDPRWAGAPRTDVRVRNAVESGGEWAAAPTVRSVAFEAVSNDEGVAFRIWWDDPTEERASPPDRLALALKPAGAQGDVVTLQAWPYAGSPPLDLSVWSAERSEAWAALADSYEGALDGGPARASLTSAARYEEGRWHLVLHRPFRTATGSAAIADDGFTAVAFAVWDGGNPTTRAVSPWVELDLRGRRARTASH
jgi:cytochrome c oxidase cbb3-type subunit 2